MENELERKLQSKDYFESNTYTKFEDPFGFFKDEKGKSNLKTKIQLTKP